MYLYYKYTYNINQEKICLFEIGVFPGNVRVNYCINLFLIVQYIVREVSAMLAANYSTVRDNFKDFCDKANNDAETIFVTRKAGGNVVILSEGQYNNIMENLYIRSNKKNYVRLMDSIQQLKQGKASERIISND